MHHVKLILIKGVLTILSIAVLYYKQVTTILSITVHNLGLSNIHPLSFNEHALMLRLSGGYCLVAVNSSFCGCHQFWCLQGYEATPLWVARLPLHMGGSILHQGGRHLLIPLPDMEGYLPITTPMLGLANHDPVL